MSFKLGVVFILIGLLIAGLIVSFPGLLECDEASDENCADIAVSNTTSLMIGMMIGFAAVVGGIAIIVGDKIAPKYTTWKSAVRGREWSKG